MISKPLLSHSIRIYPTKDQIIYLSKACGISRFIYNHILGKYNELRKLDSKANINELKKQFNSYKRDLYPWIMEVTKCAPEYAIINLMRAFDNFFKKRAKYPKFRKKGKHDSFSISNDKFTICGKQIRVPKLGNVRMAEELRLSGKIMKATVSRIADKWFVSISVEVDKLPKQYTKTCESQAVGIDLGIKTYATLSTEEQVIYPKFYHTLENKLHREQRRLSRKKLGSNNRKKQQMKVARLHSRIANLRKDFLHKFTTQLTTKYSIICIEDLNVKGMSRNRKLAKSIVDNGFREFRRQLEYKAKLYNSQVIAIDRFFPSSKMCSECGHIKENLSLKDRSYVCEHCGTVIDRDYNASINIAREGYSRSNASGDNVRLLTA